MQLVLELQNQTKLLVCSGYSVRGVITKREHFEWKRLYQGSKKVLSGCPGQVDFPVRQVTLHSHLPNGQGPRRVIC